MRVKTAPKLRLQLAQLLCHASVSVDVSQSLQDSISFNGTFNGTMLFKVKDNSINKSNFDKGFNSQLGASNLLLALFVAAMFVTAMVAVIFGHKLGYQSGYHSQQSKNDQAIVDSEQATTELKDLRISQKVLTNQVATAKQELAISLSSLDELRQNQQEVQVESRQTAQLNELYATLISQKGGMSLRVLGAKIEPLPENAFEYGFDVGMLSKEGSAKDLRATLTLQNDDDFVEVPLEPARFSIQGIVRIRGRFVMPADFKPLQVKLNLVAGGQRVEQLYDWTVGDMVDNMPLSLQDLPEVDQNPIGREDKATNPKQVTQ